MVVFNYTGRELSGKIVYYGPALSGKTTNLEHIYGATPATTRGKMVSMKTKAERTLFFDLLPINRGSIGDFKVRYLLYTVPGQVYYNATRKLVLKGADAIVFVADSQRSQLAANIDSLRNLRTNLLEYGMCLDDLPWVIGYNKRDMPDAMPIEELERELNPYGVPSFPQVAVTGDGVFEAFEKVGEMLMHRLEVQLKGDKREGRGAAGTPGRAPAGRAPVGRAPAAKAPAVKVAPGLDGNAMAEVRDAIQTDAPARSAPALPRRGASNLVIQHGFEGVDPAAAPVATATAATAAPVAGGTQPLMVTKSIVVPVPAAELVPGRQIQLRLDITLDPQR